MGKGFLLAVCCALWLGQPASATGYYITMSLAKPNTLWPVFFDDRNRCLSDSSHSQWYSEFGFGQGNFVTTTYNWRKFTDCMFAKGYHTDPNGYRAVWMHLRKDGRYWMGGL